MKQPNNLEEAVEILKKHNATPEAKSTIIKLKDTSMLHHGYGTALRNSWNLWVKTSPIVKWFKDTYDIDHADDISGIILDAFIADMQGKPRKTDTLVARYKAHWKKMEELHKSGKMTIKVNKDGGIEY